ncbi:MAG: DUF2946 family protein [Rubrivivax sp.]|nr:DUF2946 family protein [Rubrivivax sp.]
MFPLSARRFTLGAWMALTAMLALAALPTVSRALAFADGDLRWAEVCTASGMKLAPVAVLGDVAPSTGDTTILPGDDGPAMGSSHLEHCSYCGFSGGAAPLPAAAASVVTAPALHLPPALFLQAPRTLFAWRGAQPRAPPPLV